jgi:hypothetical protein
MILIHSNKLSAYTDEISDDPIAACNLARSYGLELVSLRRAWTGMVTELHEEALRRLKGAMGSTKVLLLSSELGLNSVTPSEEEFNKPFLVANYFGARFIKVSVGPNPDQALTQAWMERVSTRAIKANLTPILEYQLDFGYWTAQQISKLLEPHRRWRLLFDPTQFIVRRNLNVFEQYWIPLKRFVAILELRDFKIGVGFRPAGHGDAKLAEILKDAQVSQLQPYCVLEPGLGPRFGNAVGREAVFKLAYNSAQEKL